MTYCKHCGEPIQLTEIFGWIHGELDGGWNTSCEDDRHRAEPKMQFKPSELPVKTIIDEKGEGEYIKDSDGSWLELWPHCASCGRSDVGSAVADEHFTDFKIISLPFEVVESLAEDVLGYQLQEWHTDDTVGDIIKQTIKNLA